LHGNIGLALLNEVALGDMHRIQQDDSSLLKPPPSFHSIIAEGQIMPDESAEYSDYTLSVSTQPVIIPQGKPKNTNIASSFAHNEYLVYSSGQCHMKYLLMLKFG